MVSQFLLKLEPFTKILPTVEKAPKSVLMRTKVFYTFLALVIYTIGQQVPLFGMKAVIAKDPEFWLRQIFAGARGTVMELGLGPTMTASFVIRLFVSAGLIQLNRNDDAEMDLFGRVQSFIGAVLTIGQAFLNVIAGMYGPMSILGFFNATMIVAQLTIASVLMQCLDSMMENGWGVGSGTSLFSTATTCQQLIWRTLSFIKIDRGYGTEFEGAIPAAIHMIITRGNKFDAIRLAFFRTGLPNLMNVVFTVLVFCGVVWLQGVRKNIEIQHQQGGRATSRQFPIKLLYASSTPMMLIQQITSNIFMFSQALWKKTGSNILTMVLGLWQENEQRPGQLYPVGGAAWILAPPYSFRSALFHPLHTLLHAVAVLVLSGYIARVWVTFSGESAKEHAAQLRQNGWVIPGYRAQDLERELDKHIPVAAMTGGVVLGALSLFADISGTLGSGSGLLMAATTLIKVYEDYTKEAMGMN